MVRLTHSLNFDNSPAVTHVGLLESKRPQTPEEKDGALRSVYWSREVADQGKLAIVLMKQESGSKDATIHTALGSCYRQPSPSFSPILIRLPMEPLFLVLLEEHASLTHYLWSSLRKLRWAHSPNFPEFTPSLFSAEISGFIEPDFCCVLVLLIVRGIRQHEQCSLGSELKLSLCAESYKHAWGETPTSLASY